MNLSKRYIAITMIIAVAGSFSLQASQPPTDLDLKAAAKAKQGPVGYDFWDGVGASAAFYNLYSLYDTVDSSTRFDLVAGLTLGFLIGGIQSFAQREPLKGKRSPAPTFAVVLPLIVTFKATRLFNLSNKKLKVSSESLVAGGLIGQLFHKVLMIVHDNGAKRAHMKPKVGEEKAIVNENNEQ